MLRPIFQSLPGDDLLDAAIQRARQAARQSKGMTHGR
jgi:hypothetical protein